MQFESMKARESNLTSMMLIMFTVIGALALMRSLFHAPDELRPLDAIDPIRIGMSKTEVAEKLSAFGTSGSSVYSVDFGTSLYSPSVGVKAYFGVGDHAFSIESVCGEYGLHRDLLGVSCGASANLIQAKFNDDAEVYCNSKRPEEKFYHVRKYSVAFITEHDVVKRLLVKVPSWMPRGWRKCNSRTLTEVESP